MTKMMSGGKRSHEEFVECQRMQDTKSTKRQNCTLNTMQTAQIAPFQEQLAHRGVDGLDKKLAEEIFQVMEERNGNERCVVMRWGAEDEVKFKQVEKEQAELLAEYRREMMKRRV